MIAVLVDHLWQSTLFALGAALIAWALARDGAGVRHALWFAASVKFLVPFSLLGPGAAWIALRLHAAHSVAPQLRLVAEIIEPGAAAFRPPLPAEALHAAVGEVGLEGVLLLLWALGFGAVCAMWALRWRRVRILVRRAAPLAGPLPLPSLCSTSLSAPAVVGVFRPRLILPPGVREVLSHDEFDAVLAHELSHVRRGDNLTGAIHMAVEALFWFHPLVWWIGARLVAERERACDEAVVRGGADAEAYARGILKICRRYLQPDPAFAAAVCGVELKARIERIMTLPADARLGPGKSLMIGLAALVSVAAPALARVMADLPVTAPGPAVLQAAAALVRPAAPRSVRTASSRAAPEGVLIRVRQVHLEDAPDWGQAIDPPPQALQALKLEAKISAPVEMGVLASAPAGADAPAGEAGPGPVRGREPPTSDVVVAPAALIRAAARSCRKPGLAGEMAAQTISTQFDDRVRRFVDGVVSRAPDYRRVTPQMATAMRNAFPAAEPMLGRALTPAASVQLVRYASFGDDVYLVRHQGMDAYTLVWVNDLGQIDGALFCVGS